MSQIKIDKEVPLPPLGVEAWSKYPLGQMKVGDSFFSDTVKVRTAAWQYGNKYGQKFTTRAVDGGFRVWRIA